MGQIKVKGPLRSGVGFMLKVPGRPLCAMLFNLSVRNVERQKGVSVGSG